MTEALLPRTDRIGGIYHAEHRDTSAVAYRYGLEHHDEIGDLVDHILDSCIPLSLTAAEMRARFGSEFSVEEYDEALSRIRDQGW